MMWEYKKIVTETVSEELLNKMGLEGWEHYETSGNRHLFKRPLTEVNIEPTNNELIKPNDIKKRGAENRR